jgi:prolyl oligopeptidase
MEEQPVARKEVVTETFFGTTIEDPYRWMEDWKGKELRAWVEAQGAYTRAFLDAIPQRQELLQRIVALGDAAPALYDFSFTGGRFFYLRRDPGEQIGKLVVRMSKDAEEKVLLDPNALAGDVHSAIDWYTPSQDGQFVAYGISQGGSEDSTLHVLEVDSGKVLDLAISRTQFGGVNWLEDNRSFVYHRLKEQPADAPETEYYNDSRVYLHRAGNDPEQDLAVFGRGINSRVEIAPEDFPLLDIAPDSDWVLGVIAHGVLNEQTIYTAPRSALSEPATCPWTKVADIEDCVTGFAFKGDTIYLKTHRDAPRFKIIATSLKAPDLKSAAVVIPESKVVIQNLAIAGDYLLTYDLDGGIARSRRLALNDGTVEQVALPFEGSITDTASDSSSPLVVLQLTSWTISPRIYLYNSAENVLQDSEWLAPSPVDFSNIEAHEVLVATKDGVKVPLSIIHQKGLALDSNHPTLLMGYGSYGITIEPAFSPTMLAWYERGGVYAVAHIRGGGEYGEEWHKAGYKLNKQNTINDLIACAEYLIAQKYTRPERLAGEGTSAGGIPSGGALVQRPDLWAVMVMRVAVTNTLRSEFSENGPPNVPEFGTITTEEGFDSLYIIDSYNKVQDGVKYPAVLLTTGLNDPRVVLWEATKMAARLQAATASGKPILLRVETQGGHGMGSTLRQLEEELADKLAFLLHQMSA